MKPEICTTLTLDNYLKYGDRKVPGRISLFVNSPNAETYFVPIDTEHIVLAKYLVAKSYARILSDLVPVHIDTQLDAGEPCITGIITGASGMEIGYGVRHSLDELQRAHGRGKELVMMAHLYHTEPLNENVIRRYMIKKVA